MKLSPMPPWFDGIVAEEKSSEKGEHECEDGYVDEILHYTVAMITHTATSG